MRDRDLTVLDRLVAELLLSGICGCVGWFAAHEYASIVTGKWVEVCRALGAM
jgi:hypothetical protein